MDDVRPPFYDIRCSDIHSYKSFLQLVPSGNIFDTHTHSQHNKLSRFSSKGNNIVPLTIWIPISICFVIAYFIVPGDLSRQPEL